MKPHKSMIKDAIKYELRELSSCSDMFYYRYAVVETWNAEMTKRNGRFTEDKWARETAFKSLKTYRRKYPRRVYEVAKIKETVYN